MEFLIINCHSDNRGDEAAIHSLVDELIKIYPDCNITLAIRGAGTRYPNMASNVTMIQQFNPNSFKSNVWLRLAEITHGRIAVSSQLSLLINKIRAADIVLHAPGGPSIGDTYYEDEPTYLKIFDLIQRMKKPYMFYAPSMGPFIKTERNEWRKRVINGAKAIVLRDPISAKHLNQLLPDSKINLTLDSALQHDIDLNANKLKLDEFLELKRFILEHEKCIGITITDLKWHPIHSNDSDIQLRIHDSFVRELNFLTLQGYGIVFIPQLYGVGNDYDLMKLFFKNENDFFIIPANDERYDAYFQQYVISKLYAVIGMRYHSNIFSAKMGIPFISVSYEQKMQGFMEKMGLQEYCINIKDLSYEMLSGKFELLIDNHRNYKSYLEKKHDEMRLESYKTTRILNSIIKDSSRK